ncbi:hypothetical protein, partial [Microcoleus sp. BROC3]|uniref:hypothetical protein n=1 Tax=Microcoleus sp. BROC3 TaxID=3055323 RepID=UPI002FD4EDED
IPRNNMKKRNDLIFYGSGLYEIETETQTQYSLRCYLNFADSKLIAGWVDKDAPGMENKRIPGDDWSAVQLAMVKAYERAPKGFDPLDLDI